MPSNRVLSPRRAGCRGSRGGPCPTQGARTAPRPHAPPQDARGEVGGPQGRGPPEPRPARCGRGS
eukprot:2382509-Pyramimonas_sp.AAC.1